ncbi:hypothetical protein CSOJ01_00259 [Colletotrichum sojae]|uniref:Uncharacterized protein n=1 Tax=Colletotrichum sojae TaxID=2175907 RepID=A0A8H6N6C0_9PEZI|nr:hypothetical protein CSOJ01_00259 [Colletotrichum sojae]
MPNTDAALTCTQQRPLLVFPDATQHMAVPSASPILIPFLPSHALIGRGARSFDETKQTPPLHHHHSYKRRPHH